MDGGASVVLYSENKAELLSWYSAIKDRVVTLLEQSVSQTTQAIHFFLISSNLTELFGNISFDKVLLFLSKNPLLKF